MKQRGRRAEHQRVIAISALSGLMAPLVFVWVIVFRKAHRRTRVHVKQWNKRLQHEISRWN